MDQTNLRDNSIRGFSIAAVMFGIFSLITFFTGIIPLFTGSMGLIFVALSYRKGTPLNSTSRLGMYLCVIGLLFAGTLLLYAYNTVFLPMMNDPEFYNTMNLYYQNNFGISLDEMLGR